MRKSSSKHAFTNEDKRPQDNSEPWRKITIKTRLIIDFVKVCIKPKCLEAEITSKVSRSQASSLTQASQIDHNRVTLMKINHSLMPFHLLDRCGLQC